MALFQNRRKKPYMMGSVALLAGAVGIFGVLAIQGPAAIEETPPVLPVAAPATAPSTDETALPIAEVAQAPAPADEKSAQ
ncbi:hypothetical protein KQI84_13635 [bacterium]|nr:hypothetical protein [bacterium]